jgi:tetratricopeptide (TPR) repeat protein
MAEPDLQNQIAAARASLLAHRFAEALPKYERLLRQCPSSAVLWAEYGNTAVGLRKFDLAEANWQRALTLAPKEVELITMIGHQYQGIRRPEQALTCFARAAEADSRAINPRISSAVLLEKQHHLEQARRAVDECLAIDLQDDQARYFAAVLDRRENKLEQAEQRLRDLIASEPKHPFVRYSARYALAQILDQRDQFDDAMRLLGEAKELVRGLTQTDVLLARYDQGALATHRFVLGLPKTILHTWAGFFPQSKRSAIPPLAFLGGHPRSGTTLLEQILDAHPGVAGLDEPNAFLEVLQPAFHKTHDHSSSRLNGLRGLYVGALLRELGPGGAGKLLVDKNPSPTSRLPVWLRVFPELRVLIALRDPRDVVLSCYFQNIPLNATNVNFLSFERLAKHYSDLMDIWVAVREWEDFAWLETRYEDIVQDLEKEGRRVTGFLGLEWHENQGRFYEKSRQKQLYSPTYQDVTRPIYSRSIGRWHAYEKYLAPILPALKPYCRRFGYG